MENRYATDPESAKHFDTDELRSRYLVEDLFAPGEVRLVHSHIDRVIVGGITPVDATIDLPCPDELRADFFLMRREAGVVNVGPDAVVTADGAEWLVPHGGCLYVGRGTRTVSFAAPGRFYLFSAPAHADYPTALARPGEGDKRELGDQITSNRRTLNRYIHPDGIPSCQVVMGVTTLHPGSMWNTMPSHTHERRMEAYLYFDMPADARAVHLMGQPQQTRHLIVANEQAVLSPPWSIHSACGTQAYSFVWAMAGENQLFDDMDDASIEDMR